jgi:hypothetical protein
MASLETMVQHAKVQDVASRLLSWCRCFRSHAVRPHVLPLLPLLDSQLFFPRLSFDSRLPHWIILLRQSIP